MDDEEMVDASIETPEEIPNTQDYGSDFADIREAISGLAEMLESIRDSIALFVSDGGATISEDSTDENDTKTITVEDIPGVDDLDLTI